MTSSHSASSPPDDAVIQVKGLVKSFGSVRALDGVDLLVARGEVHGFLGPNGTGKSTTIRVLLGLLKADAGQVRVLDGDPWRDVVSLYKRLAYVPGDVILWPGLTGCEAIGAVLDVELLVLDEPTSGLDPLMEAVFQEEIAKEKAKGRSVLLSSHILGEAEALADRISIIRAGKVVETGTLDQLRQHTKTNIHATLHTPPPLDDLRAVQDAQFQDGRFSASVDNDQINAAMAVLTRLASINAPFDPAAVIPTIGPHRAALPHRPTAREFPRPEE